MENRFPVLKTKRLVLREVTAKDASWYFKHFNTWEIADGQEYPGPKDMRVARQELKLYFTDNFRKGTGIRWGITLKGSDDLIGSAGFYKWDKKTAQVETGYDLDPKYMGQGIMTEAMSAMIEYAFDVMKINRMEALVSPRNKGSIGLVRRLGFRKEGKLREHDFYDGKFTDDFLFALLKSDWRRRERK
jgi:ribosomal-protein-alanine N-acetyltransferase